MKIELKKISFSERLSEETNAFVADLYINGKKAAYVKNDGQGGSTDYQPYEGMYALVNEAARYAKTLPSKKYGTLTIESDLEVVIDDLFTKWLTDKEAKKFGKKLSKDCEKGICTKTANGYTLHQFKGYTIASLLLHPSGKVALKKAIDKFKSEGLEILNKNIPEDILV
jgi:hypothetical protein